MPCSFYLVCLCAVVVLHFGSANAKKRNEQKVWDSFGRTDDQNSYIPGQKLNLSLRVQLISLSSYDPETASLVVGYYLDHNWADPSISWDKRKYNVSHLTLPIDKLWMPDIVPYKAESHENVFDTRVLIYNDGKALYVPFYKTRVTCQRDPKTRVPERVCTIKFGSWTLDGFRLNVTMKDKLQTDAASFTGLEESGWSFVNGNTTHNVGFYPCCAEPYPAVILNLRIREMQNQKENQIEEEEDRSSRKTRKPKKKYQNRTMEEEEEEGVSRRCSQRRSTRRRRCPKRRRMEEEEWEEEERC